MNIIDYINEFEQLYYEIPQITKYEKTAKSDS